MADTEFVATPPALVRAAAVLRGEAAAISAAGPGCSSGELSGTAASTLDAVLRRFCAGFADRLRSQSAGLETAAGRYRVAEAGNSDALGIPVG